MHGIYWLASYPKSGNTWFRAFLANLLADSEKPVSINELNTGSIAGSRDWLDTTLGFDTADLYSTEIHALRPHVYCWDYHENGIGYHKIHDAYTYTAEGQPLVSKEATLGAIYIVRNPLDIVPSLANHYGISIDKALKMLCDEHFVLAGSKGQYHNQVSQTLYCWSKHVQSWTQAEALNLLVIRYEDMIEKPLQTFTAAAKHLQLSTNPTKIKKAISFSQFDILKAQESELGFKERVKTNQSFFRSGTKDNYKTLLSAKQISQICELHYKTMSNYGYLDVSTSL